MICNIIKFRDFRNIENAELEFDPETNIMVGSNAQGKTSAIEGIYLFARGKSFRCNHDSEMVRFGCDYGSVEMNFIDKNRNFNSRIAYSRDGRRLCKRNDINIKKLSEFIGYFRAVIFTPDHLSLVKEGPAVRRNFLDLAISQIKPAYVVELQKYNNILKQRNALIKSAYSDRKTFDETIDIWSRQLSEVAEIIAKQRYLYTEKLAKYSNDYIVDMTGGTEKLSIWYDTPKTKEQYLKELRDNLEREIKYGATLYGVHKDDIKISLSDHEAKLFASQGQQRSIALAMKLSEGEISRELCGEYPVYLLDDVLSELDEKRRDYILHGVGKRQTFITSCDLDKLNMLKGVHGYVVENGKFRRI